MRLELRPGDAVNVEGPARVRVDRGLVEAFGAIFEAGKVVEIPPYRAVAFHALEPSQIAVEGGRCWELTGPPYPRGWERVLGEILGLRRPAKVMVIGGLDSGKTTLVTYLANRLLRMGFKVAVVDADTGQSDIGPPTTIGVGMLREPVAQLSEIPLDDAFFLGTTSPSRLLHRAVVGVELMTRRAIERGADYVLIDTTGWVEGEEARDLKVAKAHAVEPSAIVAIESYPGELYHLTSYLSKLFRLIRAPRGLSRPRSREERRALRALMYKRWLEGGEVIELPMDKVGFAYGFLGTGIPVSRRRLAAIYRYASRVLHAELTGRNLLLLTKGDVHITESDMRLMRSTFKVDDVKLIPAERLRNLLVGLLGRRGFLGLGVIVGIDAERHVLLVKTRVKADEIAAVQLGYIRVNPETYEEEGWVERWRI